MPKMRPVIDWRSIVADRLPLKGKIGLEMGTRSLDCHHPDVRAEKDAMLARLQESTILNGFSTATNRIGAP